jgi:HD-like signal output (HDOD) protein
MGLTLMDIFDPSTFAQLVPQLDDDLSQQVSCERFHIGLSHPAVAGTLVKNWGFAQEVVMGIAGHHSPTKLQGRDADYAHITYLAELGSRLKGFSFGYFSGAHNQPSQAQSALAHFGLDEDYYLNLIDDALDIYEGSVVI